MSGIAGICHLDSKPVDASLLRRMIDCVPHRGEDGVRLWTNGGVGLAHRQLASTEQALRERQPASNTDLSCWITFDGRLDNRDDLIAALEAEPAATDVDLTLLAYGRWGADCLQKLLGDFAFALWDSSNRRLFCARDHYGIRPFFYHFARGVFLFGSEVRQILQNPDVPLQVNDEAVSEWFTPAGLYGAHYRNLQRTFFRTIDELPPAHYLIVDGAGLKLRRYWDLDPKNEIRYQNRQEYFEQFSEIFREAVRCRLRSVGPVGAELSGGFDSSSIVCVAQEQSSKTLISFSMVFDQLSCDERPLIESVVKKYDHHACWIVADDLCGFLGLPSEDSILGSLDRPDQFALEKAGEALYRKAGEQSVRVMLSGEGAENHVMGSHFVLDSLIRNHEWADLMRGLRTIARTGSFKSSLGRLLRYGLAPLMPGTCSRPLYHKWFHPEFNQDRAPRLYTPWLRSLIQSVHAEQRRRLDSFPTFPAWAQQLEYENLNPAGSLLRPFRQPVERRFPYHDRRLVEYCLAIPPEVKYQHLLESRRLYVRGRVLQKEAFRTVLPDAIRHSQRKVNFNDLYRRRFVEASAPLRDLFQPPVAPCISDMGFIDNEKFWPILSGMLEKFVKGEPVDAKTCLAVNRIIQLELWLRAISSFERNKTVLVGANCASEGVLTT